MINNKGVSLTITTVAIMLVLVFLLAFTIPAVFNRVRSFSGYLGNIEDKRSKYCFQVVEELNKKYETSKNEDEQYIRYQSINVLKDSECQVLAKEKANSVKVGDDDKGIKETDYAVFTTKDVEEDNLLCCLYRSDDGK